jgi:hypothetical protein
MTGVVTTLTRLVTSLPDLVTIRDEVPNVVIIMSMMPRLPVLLHRFIFIINLDIICVL